MSALSSFLNPTEVDSGLKFLISGNVANFIGDLLKSLKTTSLEPCIEINERLSVVVTCHEAYLKFLPRCIESINRQEGFSRKVLVYEGHPIQLGMESLTDWEVITGRWGTPNPARNLGMKKAGTPWIVFFDADNVMTPGYAAAMLQAIETAGPDVGVIYTDIHFCGSDMKVYKKFQKPEWDRWNLSRKNFIDTSAAWRVEALETIGGWNENIPTEDDYWLALEMARRGWRGVHIASVVSLHIDHWEEPGRWNKARAAGQEAEALWQIRTMCIITLFSGQAELLPVWRDYLLKVKVPPRTNILIIDNSCDDNYHMALVDSCRLLLTSGRFLSVTLRQIHAAHQFSFDTLESVSESPGTLQIARVYAEVFPEITDDLIVTLEEGVIPRDSDAIWKLHEILVDDYCAAADIGAVCAVYAPPRKDEHHIAASHSNNDGGGKMNPFPDLGSKPIEVGFIGGGCTIWPNWALRQALPIIAKNNDRISSWENELCRSLLRNGHRIILHCGVICDHIFRCYS